MEPERPIEKLLRASAKKRQEEAGEPPSLHPATRRMFQSEVARVYGRAASRKDESESGWHFPNLGWVFALFIGLAVAAALMLPRSPSEQQLALADHASRAERRDLSDKEELSKAAPATPPPAAAAEREILKRFKEADGARISEKAQTGASAPAAPATPSVEALAAADVPGQLKKDAAGSSVVQRFSRLQTSQSVDETKRKLGVSGEVLASFQFRRNGQSVEIVDADGSVYEGTILANEASNRPEAQIANESKPAQQPVESRSRALTDSVQMPGVQFEVKGTNRMNQSVTFSGALMPHLQVPGGYLTNVAGFGGEAKSNLSPNQPTPAGRISGTAVVDGKAIQIEALPAR